MRLLVRSASALCAACLGATCALAQTGQWGQAEDQIPPYRTHVDRRHGHDHVYPDRGAVVRDLPQGTTVVNYAGISYRFAGGVWYERLGPAYIVVAPPIGVIVPQLPPSATGFNSGGKSFLYADDVFYQPRPDLGGYEVVNDPEDLAPGRSQASGASPGAAAGAPSSPSVAASPPKAAPRVVMASVQPRADQPPAQESAQESAQDASASSAASTDASAAASGAVANPTGVAIFPRNGQSADQQAIDRYKCYRFAVVQARFDPLASHSDAPPAETARHDSDYSRAQAACLEDRGYNVR